MVEVFPTAVALASSACQGQVGITPYPVTTHADHSHCDIDNAAKGSLTTTGLAVGGSGPAGGGSAVSGSAGDSNGGSVSNSGGFVINSPGASTYSVSLYQRV